MHRTGYLGDLGEMLPNSTADSIVTGVKRTRVKKVTHPASGKYNTEGVFGKKCKKESLEGEGRQS